MIADVGFHYEEGDNMDYKEAFEYGSKIIFTQQIPNKPSEYNAVCLKAIKFQIPQEIKIEKWSPTYCPNCKEELSQSEGDGYYSHPKFLEMCPHCGQKIFWS